MKIKLERPLAIFDLEATGLNISKDRIVEIAILKINPDGSEERFRSLINPTIPISEEVTKIHGISDETIKSSPTFSEMADKIVAFIEDADLAGYNSNKFDIPMLAEELIRAGSNFDLSKKHFIDVQNIFHKMEQRTLIAAYQFYCKKELVNAHNAMNDTVATWEVLKSQLEKYENLEDNIPFLAHFSRAGEFENIDFAGRLAKNKVGDCIYNFGKHKGKTIQEIHEKEPGYYSWFISPQTDFPLFTKQKLKEHMTKLKEKEQQNQSENLNLEEKLKALKSKFN